MKVLGITGTASEADIGMLDMIWSDVELLVKDYIGYNLEQATYSEYHPDTVSRPFDEPLVMGYEVAGNQAVPYTRYRSEAKILQLRELPVRTVQTVYEDPLIWRNAVGGVPPWNPNTILPEGIWFMNYESLQMSWTGQLIRLTGAWSMIERSVRVDYTAGLTAAEIDTRRYRRVKPAIRVAVLKEWHEYKAHKDRGLLNAGAVAGPIVNEALPAGWSGSFEGQTQRQNYGLVTDLPPESKRLLEPLVRTSQYIGID